MGDLTGALDAYSKATKRFPSEALVANGYARALRAAGKPEDALTEYSKAKEAFPTDPVTFSGYAETLRDMGQLDRALIAYSEAKERFTTEPWVFNGYAAILRDMARFDEALAAYADAAERFKTQPVSLSGYAATLRDMGSITTAEKAYRDALKRFPQNRVLVNALASLLINSGRAIDALHLLKPSDPPKSRNEWRDYHVLAMAYLRMGNMTEAMRRLELGVSQASFDSVKTLFRCTLATLKLQNSKLSEAQELLRLTTNMIPFPEWAIIRAHAEAAGNERDKAKADLRLIESHTRLKPAITILKRAYALGETAVRQGSQSDLIRELYDEELKLLTALAA